MVAKDAKDTQDAFRLSEKSAYKIPRNYLECFDNGGCEIELNGMIDVAVSLPGEVKEVKEIKEQEEDPWAILDIPDDGNVKWAELNGREKVLRVLLTLAKVFGLLFLLYSFVCSLDVLSNAFRLVGGKTTGEIFMRNDLMQNPVVGVMIGIITTVLVQSSSTSTSIVVSMVSADFLTVRVAIPIVLGANIGTSVTNTIVSLTQMGDRNEFRRAFAAATVHDMFNWTAVIILFIVEVVTRETIGVGYLEFVSGAITSHIGSGNTTSADEIKLLNTITDPLTKRIVQLDKKVLNAWSTNDDNYANASLVKSDCYITGPNATKIQQPCSFLFSNTGLTDWKVGLILLILSLFVLCSCLIGIVKILNSMMKGQIVHVIRRVINANIPYVPWITDYLALLIGAIMTFLMQSSSVFTSTLTPLVGVGVISLERVYPLTLGSNIGTTTTSLIAALAADPHQLRHTLQISLCHLLFNITGLLLFFPIPVTRIPIPMAKFLGNTTAKYRWFSVAYLIVMFFVLPLCILGLSIAGRTAMLVVAVPFVSISVLIGIISFLQRKAPHLLPNFMRNWKWLPLWARSLEPTDRLISRLVCCLRTRTDVTGVENPTFQ